MTPKKMSTVNVLIFSMVILFPLITSAQFKTHSEAPTGQIGKATLLPDNFFRGASSSPSQDIPGLTDEAKPITSSHKSPILAAALSFVIPGLGEYYVGDDIWRGLIFTALDVGLWYERFHYLGRGDDSTTAFQNFSDENWLPSRYADSLNSRLTISGNSFRITDPTDFDQINKAEDSLNRVFPNFSHHLPAKGSQQYYEIISKYIQYRIGWIDFVGGGTEFSPDYERAADLRGNMNYQYQVADYFLYGLFLNRILSAIDAVLLARDHNTPIHLEGELQKKQLPGGAYGYIPTAKFLFRF
ncbi:MAG: hypothetical protein ABI778_08385 [Ignavibacteriota bacterium]